LPASSGGGKPDPVKRVLIAAVLTGCPSREPAVGADGPAIFAKMCTTCHGSDGRPTAQMIAQIGVRDLTSPELRARVTLELVEQQVRKGSTNKLMPGFEGLLDDAQIRAVAAYVAAPGFVTPPRR
jgi:mono/diheme cytochrome c family protein